MTAGEMFDIASVGVLFVIASVCLALRGDDDKKEDEEK